MGKEYAYNLRDYQLHCVKLLDAFDSVCRKHGLHYYMIAGTLLGAVRHHGFIPWDDDIDVALLRDDYDRLIEHAAEWLPEQFNIVTHENNPAYPKYFAKMEDCSTTLIENRALGYVGGVYIDIFPLDAVPDAKWRRNLHFYRFNLVRRLLYLAYRDPYKHGRGLGAALMLGLQKVLSKTWLNRQAQRIIREYHGCKGCNFLMTHDDGTAAYPSRSVASSALYEFEGREFFGPSDANVFLSSYYGGDFMQLPPEEKRRSHFHDYCDLTKPYATYNPNEANV